MNPSRALIVGIDPALIDFSKGGYGPRPDLDAAAVQAALRHEVEDLDRSGIAAELCMIDFGETAAAVVRDAMERDRFDVVLFGAGLRLNPGNTALFESVVDVVRRAAPGATLAFNTKATDTAEAIRRRLASKR